MWETVHQVRDEAMSIHDMDPHVLQRMAEEARRASKTIESLRGSGMLADADTPVRLAQDARQAFEVAQDYLRTNPLLILAVT